MNVRVLLAAALFAGPAAAQAPCGPIANVAKMLLNQYGEKPVAMGLIDASRVMQLFVGPKDTWTVLSVDVDGKACLLASGQFWSGIEVLPKGEPM